MSNDSRSFELRVSSYERPDSQLETRSPKLLSFVITTGRFCATIAVRFKSAERPGRRDAPPRRSDISFIVKHSSKQLTQKLLRDELLCSNPREGGLPDPAIQQTNDEAFLDR